MACSCGNKVERTQPKILCAKCKKIFHLACVGIKPADAEFLFTAEKCFYCKDCSAVRRSSLRSPPTPLALLDAGCSATSSSNTKSDSLKAKLVALQKPSHNNLSAAKNQHDEVSLGSLYNIIISLRADNAQMLNSLTALHEENKKLVVNAEKMNSELTSMQNSQCQKNETIDLLRAEVNDLRSCVIAAVGKLFNNVASAANCAPISTTACPAATSGTPSVVSPPVSASDATHSSSTYSSVLTSTNNAISSDAASACGASRSAAVYCAGTSKSSSMLSATPPSLPALSSLSSLSSPTQPSAAVNVNHVTTVKTTSLGTSTTPRVWKTASNKKRNKRNEPLIIGSNNNNELSVVANLKWLHVSSFSPDVTANDIVSYVAKHACIDVKFLTCYALVKKDTNVKDLKKVNFKLGVFECSYDKLINANIWPANVIIRPFRFSQKDGVPEPK